MTYNPSNPVTLPKLGNINLTLSKTPFQFPNSGVQTYPFFFLLDGTGGFFGLSGAYIGASIWGGSGQNKGLGTIIKPLSWWGFTVDETGIFNYELGPALSSGCSYPSELGSPFYYPGGSGTNDYPSTIQGPDGIYGIIEPNPTQSNQYMPGFRFKIPGVLPFSFENISSQYCPTTYYNADDVSLVDGYEIWPTNDVYTGCVPYLIMESAYGSFFPVPKIIGGSSVLPHYYPLAVKYDPTNGIMPVTFQPLDGPPATGVYVMGSYGSGLPGVSASNVKIDPFNGNCMLQSYQGGGGFFIGSVFAPFAYSDPSLYYGNPMPLNGLFLSDPTDQSYLAAYSQTCVQQMPGGGFLIFPQGFSSSGSGTGFIIKRDFSGYYSVQVEGGPANWSAGSGVLSGSYGVSALGNLFVTDYSGNLYSSMGSAKIFDVLGFPDLQVTAVGCRRFDGCQLSFAG